MVSTLEEDTEGGEGGEVEESDDGGDGTEACSGSLELGPFREREQLPPVTRVSTTVSEVQLSWVGARSDTSIPIPSDIIFNTVLSAAHFLASSITSAASPTIAVETISIATISSNVMSTATHPLLTLASPQPLLTGDVLLLL